MAIKVYTQTKYINKIYTYWHDVQIFKKYKNYGELRNQRKLSEAISRGSIHLEDVESEDITWS